MDNDNNTSIFDQMNLAAQHIQPTAPLPESVLLQKSISIMTSSAAL